MKRTLVITLSFVMFMAVGSAYLAFSVENDVLSLITEQQAEKRLTMLKTGDTEEAIQSEMNRIESRIRTINHAYPLTRDILIKQAIFGSILGLFLGLIVSLVVFLIVKVFKINIGS